MLSVKGSLHYKHQKQEAIFGWVGPPGGRLGGWVRLGGTGAEARRLLFIMEKGHGTVGLLIIYVAC